MKSSVKSSLKSGSKSSTRSSVNSKLSNSSIFSQQIVKDFLVHNSDAIEEHIMTDKLMDLKTETVCDIDTVEENLETADESVLTTHASVKSLPHSVMPSLHSNTPVNDDENDIVTVYASTKSSRAGIAHCTLGGKNGPLAFEIKKITWGPDFHVQMSRNDNLGMVQAWFRHGAGMVQAWYQAWYRHGKKISSCFVS